MQVNLRIRLMLFVLLASSACCLYSCKKLVEVGPPDNQLITSTVFGDSVGATSAVIGIYTNLNPYTGFVFGNGAITAYTGLSADELLMNNGPADEDQFYKNVVAPNNNINNGSIWNIAYSLIYQTNTCIEGISSSTGISGALKNQLTGECKFLRAFIYFNLVNLYGDVPLVLTTNYKISSQLPRASTDSIYMQIKDDLYDAETFLTSNYISGDKSRANKYAALCLLARVYLYTGEWQQADSTASEVIASNLYGLENDLNNVFLATSAESVWQIPPYSARGIETTEGYFFVPYDAASVPSYTISPYLLNAFESGDERKQKWLNKNSVSVNGVSHDFYYPFKYKLGYDGNTTPVENYVMFRLAEQYLIRAEARAHLNELASSLADLNIIRNRAGLQDATTNSRAALINTILHERQVELFCEWGHRWYDLKRTKTINSVLATEKHSWKPYAALFPIPQQQIRTNTFLTQNPGY